MFSSSYLINRNQLVGLFGIICLFGTSCGRYYPTVESLLRVSQDDDPDERYRVFKATQKELITSSYVLNAAMRDPRVQACETIRTQSSPVSWLKRTVKVTFPDDSEIMKVTLSGAPVDDTRLILEAVVNAYTEEVAQADRTDKSQALEVLRSQHRTKVRELQQLLTKSRRLSKEIGVGAPAVQARQEVELERIKGMVRRIEELKSARALASVDVATLDESDKEKSATALRRLQKLDELIRSETEDYNTSIVKFDELFGYSSDVEMERWRIDTLRDINTELTRKIEELELKLKERPRIQLVQRAIVMAQGK